MWQDIFDLCNRFGYDDACRKLKSLRPSWKPSEEQPEADLDFSMFAKEIDAVYNLPKEITENTKENPLNWEYAIARHFYELGLNARKEGEK